MINRTEFIDRLGPGHIQFDADGRGEFVLKAVPGGLGREFGPDDIHLTWKGSDEVDHSCGDGDAQLQGDGPLTGEFRFHLGGESSFTARPW